MATINVLCHGAVNCSLYRSAQDTKTVLENLGHTVRMYPATGMDKRLSQGKETGDLTVLLLPPLLLSYDAYEYAGLEFNPDIPHVGYWYWETDCVPESWVAACAKYKVKYIWAPTPFVRKACQARDLSTPILDVRPYVASPKWFTDPPIELQENSYVFLTIFDCASIIERKNPIAVIDAFRAAFTREDNVQLVVKSVRGFVNPKGMRQLYEACGGDERIQLIDESWEPRQMNGMMRRCDCYVSTYRCEGLGLPIVDAAYLNKPVIVTNFGGPADFMPENYPGLIPCAVTPVPPEVPAYGGEGCWAVPYDSGSRMRDVVTCRKTGYMSHIHSVPAYFSIDRARKDMTAALSKII